MGEPRGHARGIIAIGDFASDILAIGTVARGLVAIGGVAFGLISKGANSILGDGVRTMPKTLKIDCEFLYHTGQ